MILHILQNEKVSRGVIGSCRKYLPAEEHPFVVFGGPYSFSFDDFENVSVYPVDPRHTLRLIRRMKQADRIVFHGLFSFTLLCILALSKNIGRKATWGIYGDDLYCLARPKSSLSNKLHLWVRRKACGNVKYIDTNVRGDYALACKLLGKEFVFLQSRFGPDYISGIQPYADCVVPHEALNILVGNSATPTNRHRDALMALEKYKDENIRIFAPLSYGDSAYGEKVIELGRQLFGDKFVPLTDFMPREEYFRFLMSIDAAVFANDRQQAMGNILALLYAGKKLYLRDDTTMWDCLCNEYGLRISSFSELERASFEELKTLDFDLAEQRRAVEEMTDEGKYIQSLNRDIP